FRFCRADPANDFIRRFRAAVTTATLKKAGDRATARAPAGRPRRKPATGVSDARPHRVLAEPAAADPGSKKWRPARKAKDDRDQTPPDRLPAGPGGACPRSRVETLRGSTETRLLPAWQSQVTRSS